MATEAEFPQKLQCLFQPKRFKILYGGRGAGRSWGVARALLLIGAERPIRVLCAREFQNSITDSVHKLLADQINNLGLGDFYEIQASRIVGRNGTSFAFEGIKNNTTRIKSYEGIDYCWVEEAVKVSRASWGILIPTIRKDGSEIWMTFNPELETDYTYQRFVVDSTDAERKFVIKMTWRDNPFFPPELLSEMEADKRRDPDYYLNVWEGHTIQMLEGVVYAKEMRRAQEENRIIAVPYDRTVPVNTYWDLGRADNTAIWFAQRVAMQWRILAYYEASGEDIGHFIKYLQNRSYVYGHAFLPHDARARRLGTKLTIEEQLREASMSPVVVPKQSLLDGINAARIFFPNCYFDQEKCADGLNALRHYRYRIVDGAFSNEPIHDQFSDGADAFRYMALASHHRSVDKRGVLDRLLAAKEQARATKEIRESGRNGRGGNLGWLG